MFYQMDVQMSQQPLLGSLSFLYQFTMYKSCVHAPRPVPFFGSQFLHFLIGPFEDKAR